jgi:AGZA family xanthine/uracil permease-like MFS transporter
VFIIDRKFVMAAAFAAAGAVLTFFGLMHSEAIGVAMTPGVALGYAIISVMLFAMAKFARIKPLPASAHGHGHG